MPVLKILTWNINGIRACKLPLKLQLDSLDADVICLQETKVTRDQLDEATAVIDGYNSYFSFSKVRSGYSGVATYVKHSATPFQAEDGLSGASCSSKPIGSYGHSDAFTNEELLKLDSEGRCIITEHRFINNAQQEKSLVIINVYCPRADLDNAERLSFKLQFYRLLQQRAEAILNCNSHVIILGDINTSHKKIDHCNPDADLEFYANPGRQWMDAFVSSCEKDLRCGSNSEHEPDKRCLFFDTYRWLHPVEQNAFTCWCTLTGARQTNYGSRIDYIFADFGMLPYLAVCGIMADVEGSDHCPVKVEFNCSAIAAPTCPSLCTKYFPQFAGRQQKLLQYLAPKVSMEKNRTETKSFKRLTVSGDGMLSSKAIDGPESKFSEYNEYVSWNENFAGRFNDESKSIEQNLCSKRVDCAPGPSKIGGIKRKTADFHARNLKKSKNYDAVGSGKQSSLFNFFVQPQIDKDDSKLTEILCGKPNAVTLPRTYSDDNAAVKASFSSDEKCISLITQDDECACEPSRTSTISAWKSLLKGPPRNVLCKGHQEPCVLRTVKKDGPNKGKQFWTCSRPEGHKTNPDARCDYFLWVSQTK